ncbi:hypothetical protein HF888_10010 [Bermanella marisrubri]|uniref:Outer membrane protein beta-barrel domain-containing protein n=1 Tax=Bermanella marisrubri TaxID=207949 RepID=Q1N627_9GAMM|nr:hypothetical protein [Bermanella marisrubri]EAT13765.1 hypothetical protein RED65_10244 [Oceanobacter sp. RED65] [Bermanella marisrubri]QIZ84537.1 hypothetical protein HF888_10010 [Bermanella marisrubri]
MMRIIISIACLFLALPSQAGYLGAGYSLTSTNSYDEVDDGYRFDFGTELTDWLDLEWGYINYGESRFDDPTYIPADEDNDEAARFENIGFGDFGGNEFNGITSAETQGISAGLKFKKSVNNWFQLYARVSFLAWQSDTTRVTIFGAETPVDADGNEVNDLADATNINDCGTTSYCRLTEEGESHQAVDFWYGYGFILKPFSWVSFRTEYAIVTMNAIDYPKNTFEGITTSLQIHF